MHPVGLGRHLGQDARDLPAAHEQVVRPLDGGVDVRLGNLFLCSGCCLFLLVAFVASRTLPKFLQGLAFASGLAATTAVLSLLKPGDEVAAAADLYGGTYRLLERVFKPWGLVARYPED